MIELLIGFVLLASSVAILWESEQMIDEQKRTKRGQDK